MKKFLLYTLATITGIIIASILFFIIALAGISAMVASGDKTVSVSEKTILVLKSGVEIPDKGDPDPWAGFDRGSLLKTGFYLPAGQPQRNSGMLF